MAEYQRSRGTEVGRRAAGRLFARYAPRIYHWCLRIARDHDTALDLAQEAMITALHDLTGFEERSRFSTWLYTVVRRRCLRLMVARRRLLTDDTEPDSIAADTVDPASEAAHHDEERRLLGVMKDVLDPIEMAALLLRSEEGLPVDDITRVLNIRAASGARGVLQSARKKLRAALSRGQGRARRGP